MRGAAHPAVTHNDLLVKLGFLFTNRLKPLYALLYTTAVHCMEHIFFEKDRFFITSFEVFLFFFDLNQRRATGTKYKKEKSRRTICETFAPHNLEQ